MRGLVPDHATAHPLLASLPGIYQDDEWVSALTQVVDDSLAPILGTIDNFAAYLDPALAPDDFLDWLAGWVGIVLDETWPVERRRALIALAMHLHRKRGTPGGLAMHVRLLATGDVEVTDSGGASWSRTPGSAAPGDASFTMTVKVTKPKKGPLDVARLDAIIASAKPAHVAHELKIVDPSGS
jgi:phage tail-like protein